MALVLLGEPNLALRRVIAEGLRRVGHEVVEGGNGVDLLRHTLATMARAQAPETPTVLIAEVDMPVYGGLDVLAIIRRFGWRVPLILMVRPSDGADVATLARRLGVAVVASPPDLDGLRAAVGNVM
jgi:CheY-like chemotaxis protein